MCSFINPVVEIGRAMAFSEDWLFECVFLYLSRVPFPITNDTRGGVIRKSIGQGPTDSFPKPSIYCISQLSRLPVRHHPNTEYTTYSTVSASRSQKKPPLINQQATINTSPANHNRPFLQPRRGPTAHSNQLFCLSSQPSSLLCSGVTSFGSSSTGRKL